MPGYRYSDVTPEIMELAGKLSCTGVSDPELYVKYDVKRGLRDLSGKGVLAGLTEVSDIIAYQKDEEGNEHPCEGVLLYRGYDIRELVNGFISEDRFGFEETIYLLLFGELPTKKDLSDFSALISRYRTLPTNFVRDIILKAPSRDMMNTLARGVLTLYAYDENADDISLPNVLRQCIQLIATFPLISVYAYQAFSHYIDGQSLFIHVPDPKLSTAENILHLLRPDSKYSPLEAKILDLALVLHAEHGGGNNSTFTTHVVTSSGTDTYSTMAAALASLKGPKHGGANIKVVRMFEDMKRELDGDYSDDKVADYLVRLLEKKAFDRSGLIYGMGHAVYSLSDPRAEILKSFVCQLAEEKGKMDEYGLYAKVAELAPKIIAEKRKIYKGVAANIDFYSGFVYSMLGLPTELYTPIFAIARIAGWSAHRLEELMSGGKIIRPSYKFVGEYNRKYVPINER